MVTFVGSASAQQGSNTTSITLTLPAHQADDFALAYGRADEAGTVPVLDISTAGWTLLHNANPTSGRDRVEYVWYRRFTSGSEANPTMTISIAQEHSFSVHVFRNVDTVQPFDVTFQFSSGQNDTTPVSPAITTVTDNAAIILFHGATHDDISVAGVPATPSGLTLGETILGGTNDHRGQITAYLLDAGAAGTITPTAWTHTSSPTGTAEWSVYTIALRNLQPVHVTDVDTDEAVGTDQTDVVITGDGFGATQGSGTVELWSDPQGTTQVAQTIDSWSDTSIQIDVVQGALSQGTVYVVVTNDSSEENAPFPITLGLAPYDDVVSALNPDHWWQLDNDAYVDSAGTVDMTTDVVDGGAFVSSPLICEKNGSVWRIDAVTDRRGCADNAEMNITTAHEARTMGGWIQLGGIQLSLGAIYKEGGAVNNLAFLTGYGNVLMAQLSDTGDDNVQAYSDFRLTAQRPYHIMFRYDYNEGTPEFRLYIDGEEQSVTDGNPLTSTDFDTHSGDVNWGDPDNNLEMGGTDVAFAGQTLCYYAQWATWTRALAKTTEIRDDLFRRGARPDLVIASDTPANMQIALDAVADTERRDWPLAIRVESPTGGGDLTLSADNVTFNSRCTLQVEWRGTGTLTWLNRNGSNLDSAKTFSSNGGTIAIVEDSVITLTNLQDASEVRVYDSSTNEELGGVESSSGGTFSLAVNQSVSTEVDVQVLSFGYVNERFRSVDLSSGDVSIPLLQQLDNAV